MQQYTSNAIHTLTNEQRKALAQCLVLGARPGEVLLHTKYVLISPLGDLELAAEAGQDWLKLHQEGYGIDPITGEIVENKSAASLQQDNDDLATSGYITPFPVDLTTQYDGPKAWNTPAGWLPTNGQVSGTVIAGHVVQVPFTPAQERRIRELVDERLVNAIKQVRQTLLRESADSAEEAE